MATLSETLSIPTGAGPDFKKTDLLVDSSTYVGVELEIENLGFEDYVSHYPGSCWKEVHEDSIREGVEYIFKRPYRGSKLIDVLDKMRKYLKIVHDEGGTPIITSRCSAHVHLDMRDEEVSVVTDTLLVYLIFEKVLFKYLSNNRESSNYCIPLASSNFVKTLVRVDNVLKKCSISRSNFAEFLSGKLTRYGAVNIQSLPSFGSLEFRAHPGTLNMNSLLDWINILLSIKKWAKNNPEKISTLYVKGVDSEVFCKEVFGDSAHKLCNYQRFNSDMRDGKSCILHYLERENLRDATSNILQEKNEHEFGDQLNSLFTDQLKTG